VQASGIGGRSEPKTDGSAGTSPATGPAAAAKFPAPGGAAGARADAASRFKRVLDRKASAPVGGGSDGRDDALALEASSAVLPSTLAPPRALEARAFAVSRPSPVGAVSRVLVGEGPRGSQARVEFRAGPLAGTALQLAAGRDGVHVQLIAAGEGARLALARVVDRVEARLRARGIVMNAGTDQGRSGDRRDGREQRGR
jgi:hypothetical protein